MLTVAAARRRRSRVLREFVSGAGFLAPTVVFLAVFTYYPIARVFQLSLFETSMIDGGGYYVGTEHFRDLLTSVAFYRSLWVTTLLAVYTVPVGLAVALGLALLANVRLRGIDLFRTIFSSTIAISIAIAAVIWTWIFAPGAGVANYLLGLLGIKPIGWLIDPFWAVPAVAVATVWSYLGFNVIMLLAGLQGVPDELVESARIDGAGPLPVFRHVILPTLSPTLFFLTVVGTIRAFESFGQIHVLTGGGPLGATSVIVYSIYENAFKNYRVGLASAQTILLLAMVLTMTLVQFRVLEKRVYYQ